MFDPVLENQVAVFTNALNACGQSLLEQLFGVLESVCPGTDPASLLGLRMAPRPLRMKSWQWTLTCTWSFQLGSGIVK